MLALDNALGCIEASESDILVLYRSLNPSLLAGCKPEFREAYICAIRRSLNIHVYLAMIADNGRIVVYTKSGEPDVDDGYLATVEEALNFAKALGFNPELVNLNYSSAMREVVVRNIRILRPPTIKLDTILRHGMADAATPTVAARATGGETAKPSLVASAMASALPEAAASEPAARMQNEEMILRGALSNLKVEFSLIAAEKEVLAAKVQELSDLNRTTTSELARVREERTALLEERDGLAAGAEASGGERAGLQRQVATLKQQLAEARKGLQEASTKHDELAPTLKTAQEELVILSNERDAALEQAATLSKERDATLAEAATLRKEHDAALGEAATLSKERDTALAESATLRKEHDAALADAATLRKEHDAALAEAATLRKDRDAALAEAATLRKERDPALGQAAVSKEHDAGLVDAVTLTKERAAAPEETATLREDRDALEETPGPVANVTCQIEALPAESATLAPPAEETADSNEPESADETKEENRPQPEPPAAQQSEPSEIAPQARKKEESETPEILAHLLPIPEPIPEPVPEPAAPAVALADFPFFSGAADHFFGSCAEESDVSFLLEPGVAGIAYSAPDEVIELYQSVNVAYVSPEGRGQEVCQGYICCIDGKKGKEIFAALHGVQSGRTRVYAPETQPTDDESYSRTVRGALAFAEQVGLMMEPEKAGVSKERRHEAIVGCPVLRREG